MCAVLMAAGVSLATMPAAQAAPSPNDPPAKSTPAKKTATPRTKASVAAKPKARAAAKTRKVAEPAVQSVGQRAGLHAAADPLDLKSSVALVVDQETNQVLLSKNPDAVLPIASITKLMTALVVVEHGLPMDETVSIDQDDVAATGNNRSRLLPGTHMSRGDMMRLALMSSENRAANALSRHFPGGASAFVEAMNRKAQDLGLHDTRFVEPTGLSSDNRSSAKDLAVLVNEASRHQLIRDLSTSRDAQVAVGSRQVQFHTTNRLVADPTWDILVQKTGYIAAAGRCLVMQAEMAGRKLTMVLLDSAGKYSRLGDAERIRQWVARTGFTATASTSATAGASPVIR